MIRNPFAILRIAFLCAGLPLVSSTALAQPYYPADTLPRFVVQGGAQPIACQNSPFGSHAVLMSDFEGVHFVSASGGFNALDEYQYTGRPDRIFANGFQSTPPASLPEQPLIRSYRTGVYSGALAGSIFLTAAALDLNGDGRDEVVAAHRMNGTGHLRLGVYRRTGSGAPSLELIDHWTLAQTFDEVQLAAGDLNGSGDGKQELVVLVRSGNTSTVRILGGAADGGIAQPDGISQGLWTRNLNSQYVALTVGDMLLHDRPQIVVTNISGWNWDDRTLNYHVLEFQTPIPAALPIAAGDVAVGSRSFSTPLPYFHTGVGGGGESINSIERLVAAAGDVAGSPAAELALTVYFRSSSFHHIGLRLNHFIAVRDDDNVITEVRLAVRPAVGGDAIDFDDSMTLHGVSNAEFPYFSAAIANVDMAPPKEIVVAMTNPSQIVLNVYKARADLVPAFRYAADGWTVRFDNQTTGQESVAGYLWNFGNGNTSNDQHPSHTYTVNGDYTVNLQVTYSSGAVRSYSQVIPVRSGQSSSGGTSADLAAHYRFSDGGMGAYSASLYEEFATSMNGVHLAVSDMNSDGIAEIFTATRWENDSLLRSVWRLESSGSTTSLVGRHMVEDGLSFSGTQTMALVAADLDGDSVSGTLGSDCRNMIEAQIRQVVWLPPYFKHLQSSATMGASFGRSIANGTSNESTSGSYTSHGISGYVGAAVGSDQVFEASLKLTASRNWQSSRGVLSGNETSTEYGEGFEIDDSSYEALVIVEEKGFDCYSYEVMRDGAADPDSSLRICEALSGRTVAGYGAEQWDTEIAAEGPFPHPVPSWIPLHRDWASLALFKPVSTQTSLAANGPAGNATDGLFDTWAGTNGATLRPYLQIDLGEVRDISNIRVFPGDRRGLDLEGFRIYASMLPMSGPGVPAGGAVQVFGHGTGDDLSRDQWSLWTRSRNDPDQLLRARYIRLQHPGPTPVRLRVSEIQVFGSVHAEPPRYPDWVCDPVKGDGRFQWIVWTGGEYRAIHGRGELLWSGFATNENVPAGHPSCTNHADVIRNGTSGIWRDAALGTTVNTWYLSQATTNMVGEFTSTDSNYSVGAEFDLDVGFLKKFLVGGSYEYTSGVTSETQTSSFWTNGLEIAGSMGSFQPSTQACRYRPRPYGFMLKDRSNTGYEHSVYVVDYAVHHPAGSNLWQRSSLPAACQGGG